MKKSTDRFVLVLVLLALVVIATLSFRIAIDGRTYLTGTESSASLGAGNKELTESDQESCLFVDVKGPAGVRALKCLMPATVGEQ